MIAAPTPNECLSEALAATYLAWKNKESVKLKKHLSITFGLLHANEIIATEITDNDLYHVFAIGNKNLINHFLSFPAVTAHLAEDDILEPTEAEVPTIDTNAVTGAAENGNLGNLEILLAKLPSEEYQFPALVKNLAIVSNSPLRVAASRGHVDFVARLLEFQKVAKDIDAFNNEALREAAAHGHVDMVKLLLQFPKVVAKIAANLNEAFRKASSNGHFLIVELFLKKLPSGEYAYPAVIDNIAARNNYALYCATFNGHLKIVKRLLAMIPETGEYEFPAVVENMNSRILSVAISEGHLDIVRLLLAKKLETGEYEFPQVFQDMKLIKEAVLRLLREKKSSKSLKVIEYLFTEFPPPLREAFLAWDLISQYQIVWCIKSNQVLLSSLGSSLIGCLINIVEEYFDSSTYPALSEEEMQRSVDCFKLENGLLFSSLSLALSRPRASSDPSGYSQKASQSKLKGKKLK